MARTIRIGGQDFERIRVNNNFYIDKTDFIKKWWEAEDDVTLITRPRRFGKTLNMSMLEQFFSVKYAGRGELFEGLSIWKEERFRELQGTWPVIFLSLAKIKATNYEDMEYAISSILFHAYQKNLVLLEGDCLSENEKEYFNSVKPGMDGKVAVDAIYNLSFYLSRYYGRKVLILLDEYDTPMQEAYMGGYWEEMAEFILCVFSGVSSMPRSRPIPICCGGSLPESHGFRKNLFSLI